MSNEAEKLADALGSRVVRQWTHSTGESPRAMGFKHDAECQRAAALLRRQAEQIKELREALIAMDEATKGKFGDLEFMAMASQKTGAALSNTKDQ